MVLRQILEAGEQSGPSKAFDFDEFLAAKHRALLEAAAQERGRAAGPGPGA
jgi:Arc/MetJ-type ribon-helix-helix transcriptional regulator